MLPSLPLTIAAGHCIAYVRSGDSWFQCDDSSVAPVAAAKVLSAGAYLLFYERQEPRQIVAAAAGARWVGWLAVQCAGGWEAGRRMLASLARGAALVWEIRVVCGVLSCCICCCCAALLQQRGGGGSGGARSSGHSSRGSSRGASGRGGGAA